MNSSLTPSSMESIQSIGLQRAANPGPVQVIAVTGGKGGVGKTSVAVNLATALATAGRRVMLLDGDLGLANVDVFLGMSPRHTMAHVLSGERALEESILESPHGVYLVPAFSSLRSRVDVMIVETSAGISPSVVQLPGAALAVLLVESAETASMTD